MDKLRASVIGVGSMGRRHARVYADLPETELVAVADASEANSTQIAHLHGCKAYVDYREMLTVECPDLVTVAVPTVFHLDVATTALAAGCHVLVEKPIAATVDEAQTLITAAAAANRKLMVGHIVRFDPAIQALEQHIDAGELGRLFQIICRRASPFPSRIRDVGVVLDLAPHDLDIMRYITGEEPLRVYAETAQYSHAQHEDLLAAVLRFPRGIIGTLEINWLTPTKIREVIVLGEQGMLRADCLRHELYFVENSEVIAEPRSASHNSKEGGERRTIRFPLRQQEPLAAELAAFVSAVRDNTQVPVTGADGLAALRLALALIESGEKHQLVEV